VSLTIEELDEALTIACRDRDAYAADLRAAEAEAERLRAKLASVIAAAHRLLSALDAHEDATDAVMGDCYHADHQDPVYGAKAAMRAAIAALPSLSGSP